MKEKPDYSNWIPVKFVALLGSAGVIFAASFFASFLLSGGAAVLPVRAVLAAAAVLCLAFCFYMAHARTLLSYDGGGVQGKVLDNVLAHLGWNGVGTLIDIGCGSGAMAIKAAKKYPNAWVVGVDYWGFGWDYSKKQCERNAGIEKVGRRVVFQKGDAAALDFPDARFDAAVSNFVFHEVKSQPDKLALIREALRVVKPGGLFSFGDVFFAKSHYKDIDVLIEALSGDVSEIHFVDTRKSDFMPKYLKTPFGPGGQMGLIYGVK
ncbi:MAG: class I SAM-dependent methyltransferase [Oscillospiraceae bacterium]|jgi:SAM-dependent methyltransferase|nr:class I SAM-dependent methyltransferase [Oscillospiraceae bacterium]